MLDIAAICLVVTALLAYVNHRFVGLPTTIGVMVIALCCSLAIVALDAFGISALPRRYEESLLRSIDFSEVLMQGMLSLLLFAGALHVDLRDLREQRWTVGALAVFGTVLSTAAVGYGMFVALPWVGLELPLVYCLLFGALISPTDPIAVMGILKSAGAPKRLELVIAGESLFNDGVGVVLFTLLLGVLASGSTPTWDEGGLLLLHEAGGGVLFGLVLGYRHLPLAEKHRQLPGRGAADLGGGDRRLCAGAPPASVGPAGDGGGRPDDRQPRSRATRCRTPRGATWTCSGN